MKRRILVVEDEQDVAEVLRFHLTKDGYEVVVVPTGTAALKLAHDLRPELILLDIMVPQLNGWDVCRRLKADTETHAIPIIMLTACGEEIDRLLGFELGADDYVTKPFSPRELIARVRAVVRRAGHDAVLDAKTYLRAGDLEIDRHRFEVRMQGKTVELTPREFDLLAVLAGAPGRVFGRGALLDLVWGQDGFVEPRTVDVHLARLRAKFSAADVPMPPIETVRGVGYRLSDDPSSAEPA